MNRPVYETQQDRANERDVALALERAWRCDMRQLPRMYPCDLVAYRGSEAKALIEVKRRKIKMGQYPTLHIGLGKIASLTSLRATGLPVILVAALDDAILSHRINPPYPVVHGGRTDRGDSADQEPVCEIDFNEFTVVSHV